ncbi:TPA: DUF1834 family protein, partial [Escherichia coli]|nr:DUF1834 family protein [Escherichia coli]
VESVRRLLTGQDLGLEIDYFEPGRVRTLFNTGVAERAMSVFACEFDTRWVEHALENGKWPERGAEADRLFNRYHGRLSDPDPELLNLGIRYQMQDSDAEVSGLTELREQQHEQNEG